MTRKEQLGYHLEKLEQIRNNLQKAQEEWRAYNNSFNAWVQAELGIGGDNREVHLTEILSKWDNLCDNAPKSVD